MSGNAVPISAAQLLCIDPTAYINLWEMLGNRDPEAPFVLDDKKLQLMLVAPHEAVLLSKDPPGILAFDKADCRWKLLDLEGRP